ncbi:MAG: glycosyltransferase family 39 protein, partial [Saprospiraceae bacterium]|nr:glycosyltransferase family 39 protein [Saprospiraceae bacterium]
MTEIDLSLQGMLLIISLITSYGLSYFAYRRGHVYLALFFIIFAGLSIRLFCSSDPMLHTWDERYHALVAKNIIEQPFVPKLYKEHVIDFDYKNWTANEVWLHKQPIPLWSMALSMKLFGISEFTLRLPSVLLSTISIFLTFCIALLLFNSPKTGLLAAFFQSINGLVIELASGRVATDHIDTFFLFFVELSIFFILLNVKRINKIFLFLGGIACGLAILTKWLPALIIFLLYLIITPKSKCNSNQLFTDLIVLGSATLLVALPWQIYAQMTFPLAYQWELQFNKRHFTEGLEGNGQPWWYFINRIRITVNEMIYIILLWFGYYTSQKSELRKENLFLLIYMAIPFLVFSVAKTKMQGYLLFTFPAYFIIIGLFIETLLFRKTITPRQSTLYKVNVLIVVAIFSLAVRYSLERVKPFKTYHQESLAKKELQGITFPAKAVLFNIHCPIELMFYTDCIAYPSIP